MDLSVSSIGYINFIRRFLEWDENRCHSIRLKENLDKYSKDFIIVLDSFCYTRIYHFINTSDRIPYSSYSSGVMSKGPYNPSSEYGFIVLVFRKKTK